MSTWHSSIEATANVRYYYDSTRPATDRTISQVFGDFISEQDNASIHRTRQFSDHNQVSKEVKGVYCIASDRKPSQSYRASPAIGRITQCFLFPTCHPTQVNVHCIDPRRADRHSIYLPRGDEKLSLRLRTETAYLSADKSNQVRRATTLLTENSTLTITNQTASNGVGPPFRKRVSLAVNTYGFVV